MSEMAKTKVDAMNAAERLGKMKEIAGRYIDEQDGAEDPDHPEHMATLLIIASELVHETLQFAMVAEPISGHDALVQFSGWMGAMKTDGTSKTTIEMKAPTDVWKRSLAAMANRVPLPRPNVKKAPKKRRA